MCFICVSIYITLLLYLTSTGSGIIEPDSLSVGSEISLSQPKSDIFCTACKNLHDPNSPCIPPPLSNLDSKQHLDHSYTETAVVITQPNEAYGKLKCKAPPDIQPHEYDTIPLKNKKNTDIA